MIEKEKPFAEVNIQKPEYLTKRIVSMMKPEGKLRSVEPWNKLVYTKVISRKLQVRICFIFSLKYKRNLRKPKEREVIITILDTLPIADVIDLMSVWFAYFRSQCNDLRNFTRIKIKRFRKNLSKYFFKYLGIN